MTFNTVIGFLGMLVWGALCGFPAMAIYTVAMRERGSWRSWLLLIVVLLVWFPAVTLLCLWAVFKIIGVDLLGS